MNNSKTTSRLFSQCHALSLNPSKVSTITTTAVTCIACPFTILFNALIVIAVAQRKELRTIQMILLTSLAVTDLLVGAVAEPLFIAAGILHLQNDYETMCILIVTGLFVMHLICTSIYHLTAMAWERYEAIKNAIKYKVIVTRGRVMMCAVASWVLTAISILPSALYLAGFIDRSQSNILKACFFSLPITICLVAIPVFYFMIYLEARKRQQIVGDQLVSQRAVHAATQMKVAKTTFLLTVALFLSFVPTVAILLLAHLLDVSTKDLFQWTVTLNQLNSLVNPILYFYRNHSLRNKVLEMLNMRKPSKNPIPRTRLPQDSNNTIQQSHSPANPSSREPNISMERHVISKVPRPKTTQMYLDDDAMPPRKENSSLNQTSGFSAECSAEYSKLRAASIGLVGVQEDLVTLRKKEGGPQVYSYAKKTRSGPVTRKHLFRNTGRGMLKFKKPRGNQISPHELPQDSTDAMQCNRTRAKTNAWETNLFDEKQDHFECNATNDSSGVLK